MSKPILRRQIQGAYEGRLLSKLYNEGIRQCDTQFRTSLLIDLYRGSISKVLQRLVMFMVLTLNLCVANDKYLTLRRSNDPERN